MSLDFYLVGDVVTSTETRTCDHCDVVHECVTKRRPFYFSRNITHNLGRMADEAGIYRALWRGLMPGDDVNGLTTTRAREVIPVLREGLAKLKANRAYYEQFNASNGWGMYEHFVPFVEEVLAACEEFPNAWIEISR